MRAPPRAAALFCHGDYEFSMPLTPLMMFARYDSHFATPTDTAAIDAAIRYSLFQRRAYA
jgi:hypothetical protein